MKEYGIILYATDFSESSSPAAEHALYLARLSGARLYVLHAAAELTDRRRSMVPPDDFVVLEKEVEARAVKDMEAFCRDRFAEHIQYATDIVLGPPAEGILKKADELRADLIVLGTHGRSGLEQFFLGSTAEKVVKRSPVPVLTVRGPAG